jgi:hypothetical protein
VPVGTPDPPTVAVKATPAPKVEGLLLDPTVVVLVELPIVIVTATACSKLPLVPVIVTGKLPAGVVALDVIVIVVDPDAVIDVGSKLAVAPDGRPLALKVTSPVNPADGVTVTV